MIEADEIMVKEWACGSESSIFLADYANTYEFTRERLFKEVNQVYEAYPGLSSAYYYKLIGPNRTMLDTVENRLIPDVTELYKKLLEEGAFEIEGDFVPSEEKIKNMLKDELYFKKLLSLDYYDYLDMMIEETVRKY